MTWCITYAVMRYITGKGRVFRKYFGLRISSSVLVKIGDGTYTLCGTLRWSAALER